MFRPFTAFPALLLTVAIGAAAPACASGGYYQRYPNQRDSRDVERLAYDNGYRQGFPHGERDARDRRGYRIDRDRDYRNADSGYRGYGDRDGYRRFYRNGYEAGYAEGYNRVARSVATTAAGFTHRWRPGGRNVYGRPPRRPATGTAMKPDATTHAIAGATIHADRNGTGKATTTTTAATAHAISTSRIPRRVSAGIRTGLPRVEAVALASW